MEGNENGGLPDSSNQNPQITSSLNGVPSKSLYISHFISTWNSRGFEFGAVLFLATVFPGTLLPMSIYALVRAAAAIAFSPVIGRFIDSQNRLKVVRLSILGQRLSVAFSCLLLLSYLVWGIKPTDVTGILVFIALVILACLEKVSAIMNTVSVERDWVIVIANADDDWLQSMNAQMRRIDLFCKLVSPLAIALLDGVSTTLAVTSTLALNTVTSAFEYLLIAWVYSRTPALASMEESPDRLEQADAGWNISRGSMFDSVKLYSRSHAFLPSISLSILYLTVLSFSGQMVTYLLSLDSPKLTSTDIGLTRTVSTLLEISSTFVAPRLINRLGAVRSGIWCLSWQFLCLTPGVGSFWLPSMNPIIGTSVVITTVILSRVGLWSYDLTAQLLIQNSIDASQRGTFSAIEASLQNFFELCAFSMTIIWSRPEQFKFPATVSLISIYVAAALYARFVRVRRGHLLHLPDCCKGRGKYEVLRTNGEDEEHELHGVGAYST